MARGNINLVEIIKRLLFDGRTTDINLILKELIQNADDAEAKRLAFGFSEGLVGAQHPLLGGPAFFAVNSGEFKPEHADGVMSLAESPKVDDPSTIGKFGIGLKSVFYFGEVFFFLCRSQDDHGHDEERLADVFNPYNEPRKNIRPDWDGFGPQDRSLMRAALNRLGVFDGFAIWVPLRTTAAIVTGGQKICIDPNTAGDKPLEFARMLGASEILERTQRAIPLLRHVECIEFFTPAGHACITSQCTGRSHYPDVEGHHAFRGDLQLLPGVPYTFEATEQQPPDQVFTDLQEHPLWARSSRADQTGQVADKTRAHASVTFAHKRTGQGRFQLQWAVFLPLGDPMSLDCAGETEFTVTFHGSFFVNADRRTILAWNKAPIDPGSSGALQARWNAEVARRGIFPLMLPTLARFAVTLSGQETDQLTEALASMSTFTDHRADFCREYEWLN